MGKKLRIGLLGAGRIGNLHGTNIQNFVPDAEVVIVADPFMNEKIRLLQNARSRINTAFFKLQNKTTPHWFMVKLSCPETINHAPERSRYIYDNIPSDVFGRCF